MEQLDLTIMRALHKREDFEKFYRAVPKDALDPATATILGDMGKFFRENPAAPDARSEAFLPWFLLAHPKLKPEAKAVFTAILRQNDTPNPEMVQMGIASRMHELRQAKDLTNILTRWEEGQEVDLSASIKKLADNAILTGAGIEELHADIDAMLRDEENEWGFHWSLDCLNGSMRPHRPGDFGIMAARVDTGKTTGMVHEAVHCARQVDTVYPGEERSILILNNEGPGRRVIQRAWQSALGATTPEMVAMSQAGTIHKKYLDQFGGRNPIKVFDVHDYPMSALERIIQQQRPAVVFVDMLDVVPYDGATANGGERTDQILEALYQRARLWAVKYETSIVAMSQLSAEAVNEPFPGLHTLANSRTGKPGAADWIMMMGVKDGLDGSRFISLPKNKLHKPGGRKSPNAEVLWLPDRALLKDPEPMGSPT